VEEEIKGGREEDERKGGREKGRKRRRDNERMG
jgi:hypothetical protein